MTVLNLINHSPVMIQKNDTENFSLLGPKTQQIDNLVLGKLFVPKLISTQTGCYESPTMTMETMMVVVGR